MTMRIEVQPDCRIEVMRPNGNASKFLYFAELDRAMIVIRFLIRQDLAEAAGNVFTSQATREARRAFKQLSERSPYNGQKKGKSR